MTLLAMNSPKPDEAWSLSDGVVTIRPPGPGDSKLLVAGRDAEWQKWLGPGHDDPRPTACILVADRVVGWVDYDDDCDWLADGEVNVGYNVFADHRRNGYASRALQLLVRHLASTDNHTASLTIDRANTASLELARKNGFTYVGSDPRSMRFIRHVGDSDSG